MSGNEEQQDVKTNEEDVSETNSEEQAAGEAENVPEQSENAETKENEEVELTPKEKTKNAIILALSIGIPLMFLMGPPGILIALAAGVAGRTVFANKIAKAKENISNLFKNMIEKIKKNSVVQAASNKLEETKEKAKNSKVGKLVTDNPLAKGIKSATEKIKNTEKSSNFLSGIAAVIVAVALAPITGGLSLLIGITTFIGVKLLGPKIKNGVKKIWNSITGKKASEEEEKLSDGTEGESDKIEKEKLNNDAKEESNENEKKNKLENKSAKDKIAPAPTTPHKEATNFDELSSSANGPSSGIEGSSTSFSSVSQKSKDNKSSMGK